MAKFLLRFLNFYQPDHELMADLTANMLRAKHFRKINSDCNKAVDIYWNFLSETISEKSAFNRP